jgi:hypothetical protein
MKKTIKKLSLGKTTIRVLTPNESSGVRGGGATSAGYSICLVTDCAPSGTFHCTGTYTVICNITQWNCNSV